MGPLLRSSSEGHGLLQISAQTVRVDIGQTSLLHPSNLRSSIVCRGPSSPWIIHHPYMVRVVRWPKETEIHSLCYTWFFWCNVDDYNQCPGGFPRLSTWFWISRHAISWRHALVSSVIWLFPSSIAQNREDTNFSFKSSRSFSSSVVISVPLHSSPLTLFLFANGSMHAE